MERVKKKGWREKKNKTPGKEEEKEDCDGGGKGDCEGGGKGGLHTGRKQMELSKSKGKLM